MNHQQLINNKIMNWDCAIAQCKMWSESHEKIVFTNGCFDIVHCGHVDYLARAASFGTKMVIGLNNDMSVNKLKGSGRPVNSEYARALLLAAFGFVDAVVLFGEDTPYNLIKALQPDFLVKGKDYLPEQIAGYDIVRAKGGDVITVDLVEGYSTTALIDRIKKSY